MWHSAIQVFTAYKYGRIKMCSFVSRYVSRIFYMFLLKLIIIFVFQRCDLSLKKNKKNTKIMLRKNIIRWN